MLMVVDLQGVNYILTDPQIHTHKNSDRSFGLGNLGVDGMTAFFCTHVCNPICRHMRLLDFHGKASGKSTIRREIEELNEGEESSVEKSSTEVLTVEGSSPTAMLSLSCCLCGEIFNTQRGEFMKIQKPGNFRLVYCTSCQGKINDPEHRREVTCACTRKFDYSPYWYLMIGMEPPKSCRACKERAAEKLASSASV